MGKTGKPTGAPRKIRPGDLRPRPGRGSSRARQRLFQALLDLCLERGFAGVELCALLERAQVDQSEFRRHFLDLEDCFCQCLEREREAFFAAVNRAIAEEELWVDRLRAVAYTLLRFLAADHRRCHFLTTELPGAGERASRIWSETIARPLFDLIDEGRAEHADGAYQTRCTAEAIGGSIFYQVSTAARHGTLDEAAVPRLMYSAVLPYLGPQAAARELRVPAPPQPRSGDRRRAALR
jgi:AcrR family transcriptional regulator